MDRIVPVEKIGISTLSTNLTNNLNDDMYLLEQKKIGIEQQIEEMEDTSSGVKQRELLELELKLRMIELQIQKMQEAAKVAAYTQQNQSNASQDNSLKVEISVQSLQLCLESLSKENEFNEGGSKQNESENEPKKESENDSYQKQLF